VLLCLVVVEDARRCCWRDAVLMKRQLFICPLLWMLYPAMLHIAPPEAAVL